MLSTIQTIDHLLVRLLLFNKITSEFVVKNLGLRNEQRHFYGNLNEVNMSFYNKKQILINLVNSSGLRDSFST